MLKQLLFISFLLLSFWSFSQTTFINEINHKGSNQGVEIAGPSGTSLIGWQVLVVDDGGNPINTLPLNTSIPNIGGSLDLVWIDVIMNMPGTNGGVVLADAASQVVQFLSYGGEITGAAGTLIEGMVSSNLPVGPQPNDDESLQLTGTGTTYPDFTWAIPGTLTSAAVNTNQTFGALAAPVEIMYFRGEIVADETHLKWATALEKDNAFFQIEHSINGVDFEVIGELAGQGDSEKIVEYKFTHRNVDVEENYYRLVQFDFDGTNAESEIIYLNFNHITPELQIFPNPVGDKLTLLFEEVDNSIIQIQVFDLMGKEIINESSTVNYQMFLNVSNLQSGQYLLVIQSGQKIYNQLIIKG